MLINGGFPMQSKNSLCYWYSLSLNEHDEAHQSEGRKEIKSNPSKQFFLGQEFPNIYLTERQAQCIYYLLNNLKRNQIASRLKISLRTLERHLEIARKKFSVDSCQKMLDAIKSTDFLENYNCKNAS